MLKKFLLLLPTMVFLLLVQSCSTKKSQGNGSDVDIKIHRFENELFSVPTENINQAHQEFLNKYGLFYQRYIENVVGIGRVDDPQIAYSFTSFLSDKYIREVYSDTKKKYADDLKDIKEGLEIGFGNTREYFPAMLIPEVVTFISGFQYAMAVTDSVLGIGLDMYLGSDYENYPKAGLPLYKIAVMRREYIVADAMKSWLMTEFITEEDAPDDLLGNMIQQGKIMYFLDEILPEVHDTLKTGYSLSQLEWCRKNEFNIWAHLIDQQLLFTKDPMTINKFFTEAPFTSGFPKESPSKIGVWIGWQIIKSYMANNDDNLVALMKLHNSQEILTRSRYKPQK